MFNYFKAALIFGNLSIPPSGAQHKELHRSLSLQNHLCHIHIVVKVEKWTQIITEANPRGDFLLWESIRWKHSKKWKKSTIWKNFYFLTSWTPHSVQWCQNYRIKEYWGWRVSRSQNPRWHLEYVIQLITADESTPSPEFSPVTIPLTHLYHSSQ